MPTHATPCAAGVEKYVGLYGTVPPVWAQTLTTLQVRPLPRNPGFECLTQLGFERVIFGL